MLWPPPRMSRAIPMLLLAAVSWLCSAENYLQRQYSKHQSSFDSALPSFSADPLVGMTWKNLRMSGGVLNLETAVLVVSRWSYGEDRYTRRILPAADTWMRLLANVFVMVEDLFHARHAFRSCPSSQLGRFTTFSCANEPTVVLSDACSHYPLNSQEEYSCKVDELLLYVSLRKDLFQDLRFVVITSDEYYFRVDVLFRWLGFVDRSEANHLPLIAFNANSKEAGTLRCSAKGIEHCSYLNTYSMYV